MMPVNDEKTSVLGDALSTVKTKVSGAAATVSGLFNQPAPGAAGSSAGGSMMMPLLVVGAVGFAAFKFLPNLFKKGRGSRPTSRR
jgi:hypothetical protein